MAPKKDVDKSSTRGKKAANPPKKRGKAKPPPKTKKNPPSIIKIKMPSINGLGDSSIPETDIEALQIRAQEILATHKIGLANEVALAQLKKSSSAEFPPEQPPDIKLPPKKGRPKRSALPPPSNVEKMEICVEGDSSIPETDTEALQIRAQEILATHKIGLANEEFAQLKKSSPKFSPEQPPDIKPPPKKGRPKRAALPTPSNVEKMANCIEESLKPPPRKRIRKTPAKTKDNISTPENIVEVANKQKADSTSTIKKRGRKKKEVSITESPAIIETPTRRNVKRKRKTDDVTTTNVEPPPTLLESPKKGLFFANSFKKIASPVKTEMQPPGLIDSRKTSLTSTSGSLSWTKDISSSSTTTCVSVCCNDFVRIDKKLPVLKLHNVDRIVRARNKDDYKSDVGDIGDTTNCSSSSSDTSDRPSVNLSSTSDSDTSESETEPYEDINSTLDKLSSKIKELDFDILNWIGPETEVSDFNIRKLHDSILKVLEVENDVINHCHTLKKILADDDGIGVREKTDTLVDMDISEGDENFTSTAARYVMLDQNCHNDEPLLRDVPNVEEQPDRLPYTPYDLMSNFDNSDVISICADDTLMGMDTMNCASAAPSLCETNEEEYVPKPVNKNNIPATKVTYNPTRIANELQKRLVCEKQRADSTFREPNAAPPKAVLKSELMPPPPPPPMQCRIATVYPQTKFSIVFRGMCTRYLTNNCWRQNQCLYRHVDVGVVEHKNKLCCLSDEIFIQEYMFIRNYPALLLKYGGNFVDDCTRREMTRVLVEMATDIITKLWSTVSNADNYIIHVTEETLMHLNNVDLRLCEDLLKEFVSQDKMVCDFFVECLAKTQNFSRFKQVFVRLTDFVVDAQRKVDLNAATQILERVCILPHEHSIAQALIKIIKATDVAIFGNGMMEIFEKQLLGLDSSLFDQLKAYKDENYKPLEVTENGSSQTNEEQINHERYTSPDTTKSDSANKPPNQLEQVVIRTALPLPLPPPFPVPYAKSTSTESSPDYRPINTTKFRTWKPNFSPQFLVPHHRPPRPNRPPKRRIQRNVTYGGNAKFPRRPGPDMF